MTQGIAMRMLAAAGVFGCVAGAPGREIPVYREYSQPIAFYDETGVRIAAAPDVSARRSVRDGKAQEALLGRETLFDIAFGSGASIWGESSSELGKSLPPPAGGTEDRRRKSSSDRNWLAGSLALPSLGQSASNTAAAAMGTEAAGSRWGWLADEVAARAAEPQFRQDDFLSEEEEPQTGDPDRLLREEGAAGTARDASPGRRTAEAKPDGMTLAEREPAPTAKDPAARRTPALTEPGKDLAADDGVPGYQTGWEIGGGMSQTRNLLSDITARVRPTWSSLLETAPGNASRALALPDQAAASPAMKDRSALADLVSLSKVPAGTPGTAFGMPGSGKGAGTAWQGGWKAQGVQESLSSSFTSYSDPVPQPSPAAMPRGSLKPGFSSGGTKPAWY